MPTRVCCPTWIGDEHMDVYRFLNSSCISDHLQGLGYELNAAEAAYIVHQSAPWSLTDKISAWAEIIDTMPDCAPLPSGGERCYTSTHALLRDVIELQQLKLDAFGKKPDGTSAEGARKASVVFFEREGRCLGSGWIDLLDLHGPKPFSSLDECLTRIDDMQELDECDLYRIEKACIDDFGRYTVFDQMIVNRFLEPVSVRVNSSSLESAKFSAERQLQYGLCALPVPFNYGDLVIDPTGRRPRPFVFDRLPFWGSTACGEHGVLLSSEVGEVLDQSLSLWQERVAGSWLMKPCGYELKGSMVNYNGLCICDNYLNLERYTSNLVGDQKLLGALSEYLKGRSDIIDLINASRVIGLESEVNRLKAERERCGQLLKNGERYFGPAATLVLQGRGQR